MVCFRLFVCQLKCPCMKDKECVNVTLRCVICEITTLDLYHAKLTHAVTDRKRVGLTVKIRVQNVSNVQCCTDSGKGDRNCPRIPGGHKGSPDSQSCITIGGSGGGGARNAHHLLDQNLFIFMQLSEKHWSNSRLESP